MYDLSEVHVTKSGYAYCHLCADGKRFTIKGQNEKHWSEKTPEEETVLRGDGTATILYAHAGGGRPTSVWHVTFENGYRPAKAPGDISISDYGGGALSWAQTEQCYPAQGMGLASNCVFRSCGSAYHAGATHGIDAFDCFYTNNVSAKAGGATRCFVGTNGGQYHHTNIFENCVFIDNKALNGAGGAIYGEKMESLSGCVFVGNTATQNGGAVYCNSMVSYISRCAFSNNVSNARGGALSGSDSLGSITDCIFYGNTAGEVGGGVRVDRTIGLLARCRFEKNATSSNGGGYSCGENGNLNVVDCEFIDNTSAAYGGGVASLARNTCISGTSFVGNLAQNNGGGLYTSSAGDFVVSNCTFRENVARDTAGAVYSNGDYSRGLVVDCLFDTNTNKWGNVGSHLYRIAQVTGCTFTGWGDMLATSYDRCTFDGCKFNYVTYNDGMVQFNNSTGAGHIRNCLFKDCYVHTLIYNLATNKPLEISNCTFVNNTYDTMSFKGVGGATTTSNPYIFFAYRNATDPVSGKNYPCTNTIYNCIFWNNVRDGVRNDLTFYATAQGTIPDTVAMNIISNAIYGVRNAGNDGGSAVEASNFNVVEDPGFVAGAMSALGVPYYMIRNGSPAYDAGVNLDWMADAADLYGTNRIVGARVDLGCYECWLPQLGTVFLIR